MTLKDYGYYEEQFTPQKSGTAARIVATHRERYEIICDGDSENIFAVLKSGEYFCPFKEAVYPTTGDFVIVDKNPIGDSRILETLPRRTLFSRRDPSASGYEEQAVAANFDYVFILQSLNNDFNVRRLERYLTLAWNSAATPVVILTKTDVADKSDIDRMRSEAIETSLGAEVIALSAKTGDGLSHLDKYLQKEKTIVFLGSSGVGKSSLVNALAKKEVMSEGEIREDDSHGRHTTTTRQLIMLPCGAMVIDTPGMRELGMWDVSGGIDQVFSDVEKYFGQCKFSDCTHTKEKGCAVLQALESGELSEKRFEAYKKLLSEAAYSEDKASYLAKKHDKFKQIAKINKKTHK